LLLRQLVERKCWVCPEARAAAVPWKLSLIKRFGQIRPPSVHTKSHIKSTAQPNDKTIPREMIVSGQSCANRCRRSGMEDSVMTTRSYF
jgi:hypothetical protein